MKLLNRATKFYSPVDGITISLEDVNDEVFSKKMIGDGIAIIPSADEIRAPFDGEIMFITDSRHAFGLKSIAGLEILVHVGIDTVAEKGKGFIFFKKVGDSLKKGDLISKFERDYFLAKNYDLTTIVLIPKESAFRVEKAFIGILCQASKTVIIKLRKSQ